ncbi:alpha/beta hydrolase [Kitasatospora paracochleata]|uniref:Pimeloyl-ACP methyl ester carboxylesterase n=1 Tax=Kitasatospora paracochleata TaxID=58354 RepID=A0ABT1J153_9ACTN|nr:alpha/beta hydrolase [Kitasatospora paracochleata]MCP2311137.1 pimeloyl-ACP methyl ester carboxylesterase [Kitasatospora paracochleata]
MNPPTDTAALPPLAEWTAGGRRLRVPARGREHSLFVRQDGPADGRPVTLVHGFPTSSHDWAAVVPALAADGCRVTTLDLLGFGESDKPRRHPYSLLEQADLVQAVWQRLDIGDTALVAHDYGVSVAQELLARDPARITRMAWLNGGLYADLHRPVLAQRLLHGPLGPLLVRAMNERRFRASMRRVLGRPVPDRVLHDMWLAVARDNGHLLAPLLLHYIDERRTHGPRWNTAQETHPGPTLYLWGPADPISGAHVLARIRTRAPHATVTELAGPPPTGHYPQVENPHEVAAALTAFLRP